MASTGPRDKKAFLLGNRKTFITETKKLQRIFFRDYPFKTTDVIEFQEKMLSTTMGTNLYYAIYNSTRRVVNSHQVHVRSKTLEAHIDINPMVSHWVNISFETIPGEQTEPNKYVTLVNSIIYSFTYLNPTSTVVYGTFAYHLDNLAIPYNDIDISTTNDFDLLMIILYGFHIFVKVDVEVLSIPYIVNHRCIKIIANGTKLADIHHIDADVLQYVPRRHISNLYVLDDMFAFFNTLRSLSVDVRRTSISNDKQKFINILSLLIAKCDHHYRSLSGESLDVYIINTNLISLRTNSGYTFYFVCGVLDKEYTSFVKNMASTMYKSAYTLVAYKRLSNIFADRLIEARFNNKPQSEYWINTSRNNLYTVKPTELKSVRTYVISELTRLYMYGSAGIVGLYLNNPDIVVLFYSAIIESMRNKLELNNIEVFSTRVKNNQFHNHISISPLSFNQLFPEDRLDKLQWIIR